LQKTLKKIGFRLLVEIKDAKGYTKKVEFFDLNEGDQFFFQFQMMEQKEG